MFRALAAILGSMKEALNPASDIDPERLAVRVATHKDLDAVLGLNSALSDEQTRRFGTPVGGLLKTRNQFKQAISERLGVLLVATIDGEIVGYAHAAPMLKGDRAAAWLEGLFVIRKYRQTPLLDWLAAETVKRLRKAGAAEIMTRVRTADERTIEVLKAVGMADRYMLMQRPISPRQNRVASA